MTDRDDKHIHTHGHIGHIARYDRAGKWYLECSKPGWNLHYGPKPDDYVVVNKNGRAMLSLEVAAKLSVWHNMTVIDTPGGDRLEQQIQELRERGYAN